MFLLVKCTNTNTNNQDTLLTGTVNAKPGSSFDDTLIIRQTCAVFYYPDSLQKENIKAVTNPRVFEGSMHEFFYQQKNAHSFLKKYWPHLKIIEAVNVRYLLFEKKDKVTQIVDLDKLGDSFGLIVFDVTKDAQQVDMTNIDSQVPDYFVNR